MAGVLVIDDHPVVRFGIGQALALDGRFGVCGEAASPLEARRQIMACRPDFVVLDLMLGGRDGIDLLRELSTLAPGARILVYSAQPEATYAPRAFRAGAWGYLMKDAGIERLPDALAALQRGERFASPTMRDAMFQHAAAGRSAAIDAGGLSDRELQILHLLGRGYGTAAIAAELALSIKTIGTYRERLKDKLGAENAQALEQRAAEFVRTGRI